MSAVTTSPTRIINRVSRWSLPGHDDARRDNCPAALSTAPTSLKAIVIGAQASPRAATGRHHLTATPWRLTFNVNTAIKSP
ncbi:MAG: hypothetical protein ACXU9C_28675 [Xanthobacteraceae bacterium]